MAIPSSSCLIQVERLLVTTLLVLCYRHILLFRILILYREVGYLVSLSATAQPSLLFILQLLRRLLSILLLSSNMTLMNPTLLPVHLAKQAIHNPELSQMRTKRDDNLIDINLRDGSAIAARNMEMQLRN